MALSSSSNVPSCSLSWDGQTSLTKTKSCTKVKLVGLRVSSWRGGSHVTRWCTRHSLNFASEGTAMIGTKLSGGHACLHVNDFYLFICFLGFFCKKNLPMFVLNFCARSLMKHITTAPIRTPSALVLFGFVVHSFVVPPSNRIVCEGAFGSCHCGLWPFWSC